MIFTEAAQQLYVAFFGRPADPGGRKNFGEAIEFILPQLKSIEDLVFNYRSELALFNQARQSDSQAPRPAILSLLSSFTDAAETIALYNPSGEPEAFVRAVYRNVLAREIPPSDSGLQFWVGKIQSGELDPAFVSLEILYAALRDDGNETLIDFDRITVLKKTAVAEMFTDRLNTPGGTANYAGLDDAELARQLLNQVNNETDLAQFANEVAAAEEMVYPTQVLTLAQALGLASLPEKFRLNPDSVTRDAGTSSVANLSNTLNSAQVTQREQTTIDAASNADELVFKLTYTLADSASNLMADSARSAVGGAKAVRVTDSPDLATISRIFEINPNTIASSLTLSTSNLFEGSTLTTNPTVLGLVRNALELVVSSPGLTTDQLMQLREISQASIIADVGGSTEQAILMSAQGEPAPAALINDGGVGLVQKTLLSGSDLVTRLQAFLPSAGDQPVLSLAGTDAQLFEIEAGTNNLKIKSGRIAEAENLATQREGRSLFVEVSSRLNGLDWVQQFQIAFGATRKDDVSSDVNSPRVIESFSVFEGKIFDETPTRFNNEDFDYFQVDLKAGQVYRIQINTNSFAELTIRDKQTGETLLSEKAAFSNSPLNTSMLFQQDKTIVLLVRGLSQNGADNYTLAITPDTQDKFADEVAFSAALPENVIVRDLIVANDLDYFKVDLVQGKRYFFTLEQDESENTFFNGTFGRFLDPDRRNINTPRFDFDEDGNGREQSVYVFVPETSGQYFFYTSGSTQTQTKEYELSLQSTGQLDNVADFQAGASLVEKNKVINSRFEHKLDFDYYKISLNTTGTHKFGFVMNSDNLLDVDGQTLIKVYKEGTSSNSGIANNLVLNKFDGNFSVNVTDPGVYIVEISPYAGQGTVGDYRFFLSDQTTTALPNPQDTFEVYFNYEPELEFLKSQIDEVAQLFSSLITRGFADWRDSPFGENFDFTADVVVRDLNSNALATGGPSGFTDPEFVGGQFTRGIITFDRVDIDGLVAQDQFQEVLVHELLHALGIGTSWSRRDLLDDRGYIGQHGLDVFRMLVGDSSREFVPLSPDRAHWDEFLFNNEIMTPQIEFNAESALSALSLASLLDLGYQVDMSKAEDYMLMMS